MNTLITTIYCSPMVSLPWNEVVLVCLNLNSSTFWKELFILLFLNILCEISDSVTWQPSIKGWGHGVPQKEKKLKKNEMGNLKKHEWPDKKKLSRWLALWKSLAFESFFFLEKLSKLKLDSLESKGIKSHYYLSVWFWSRNKSFYLFNICKISDFVYIMFTPWKE